MKSETNKIPGTDIKINTYDIGNGYKVHMVHNPWLDNSSDETILEQSIINKNQNKMTEPVIGDNLSGKVKPVLEWESLVQEVTDLFNVQNSYNLPKDVINGIVEYYFNLSDRIFKQLKIN